MKKSATFYLFLIGVLLLSPPLITNAQNANLITVSGKVSDVFGEPLIGVSVIEKGTINGNVTDMDGIYTLSVSKQAQLEFSYVGFISVTVPVNNLTTIDVVLHEDVVALSDVVVVGYAVGNRQSISGAVQKVSKEEMNKGLVTSPLEALQGRVSGVNIQKVSGDPTATPTVRVRGTTSLSGGNDPLIIVDGVMGDMGMLNALSPNDIESFTVLKDAAETAQYGSRGAAGVIVVTTTKGKFSAKTLSYDGSYGVQTVARQINMLSGDQFRQAAQARGLNYLDENYNTNFMDEILRNGFTQDHRLSFGSGNEDSHYNASFGYMDSKGIVETSSSQRVTAKFDVTQMFFDNKLRLEAGTFGTRTKRAQLYDEYGTFYGAAAMNPTLPTGMYEDGSWPRDLGASEITNPLDFLSTSDDRVIYNLTTHARLTWTIIDELKLSAFGSYTLGNQETAIYLPTTSRAGMRNNGGRGEKRDDRNENYLGNIGLTYIKAANKHYINALALMEGQEYKYRGFRAASSRYSSDYHGADNLGAGATVNFGDVRSDRNDYRLISGLARLNYMYDEKYIATINMRADGSSKLGKNNKWGFFPSFSLAWNVARESFVKDNLNFVNDFKIRASYGLTGNQDAISPYNSLQLLDVVYDNSASLITVNGLPTISYSYARNANPDLKWETKKTFNVGFDAAFFSDKLSLTFDYYQSKTDDMLYTYTVPQPPFIHNTLLANIGSMENNGFEVSASYKAINTKDFGLDVGANFSFQKNKVTSLTGMYDGHPLTPSAYVGLSYVSGAGQTANNNIVHMFEGEPLGVFYLPKTDGLIERDGKMEYNILDIDGVEGINIDNGRDRYIAGQVVPKYYVGGNIGVRYKAFDLQTQLNGAFGHKIYNGTALSFNHMANFPTYNVIAGAPERNIYDVRATDYWLENGNYLNIAYVTLGYNINTDKIKHAVNSIRLSASVNNLHTFTSYSGLTPMINSSTLDPFSNTFGLDDKRLYPVARTFTVGVSVNF